ncbi:hypothetical protein [Streptomyces sp. WM6368]|uniref:hypothetical protein n=1 Tax=Streptomyces sp. WM6368 TaxID=1415554 RepID=UPI00131B1E51|nr:hypothetical protein [Streptomyces sp. WM6368]
MKSRLRYEVAQGATVTDIVKILEERFPEGLRPMQFLWILQEELGIPFTESRRVLEYFDPEMKPTASAEVIDDLGRSILVNVALGDS